MSNGTDQINRPVTQPVETSREVDATPAEPTRAPSEAARAIERANNATSYQVWTSENAYNEVRLGGPEGSQRVVVLAHESPDPEKHEVTAESIARHASFRRFTNGGLTQQAAELPTHRSEGGKEVRLDQTTNRNTDPEIDRSLLTGLNSRRTSRA